MSNYLNAVVGFLFDDRRQQVALLIKDKPDWQKGKMNGIGGKIEAGEKPIDAMVREFREEAGVDTDENRWQHFASLQISPTSGGRYDGGEITCFKCFNTEYLQQVHSTTSEQVVVLALDNVGNFDLVPGAKWLIPLALHDHALKAVVVVK